MRQKVLVVTIAGGLLVVPAPVASAHGDHTSCAAFGEHVSTDAKVLQPSGQLVRQFAPIDQHVRADHAALC